MPVVPAAEFGRRLAALESWLWSEGAPALGIAIPPLELLAERVAELSDLYTLERERLAAPRLHQGHHLARLLYFLASDAPKVHLVLEELARRGERDAPQERHVVDLGCGVGATAAGYLLSLPASPPEASALRLVGIDRDPGLLAAWRAVAIKCGELAGVPLQVENVESDLRGATLDDSVDLVLCQGALNECLVAASAPGAASPVRYDDAIVDRIRGWAARRPVILIEPALRATTRPLHELRDRVIAGTGDEGMASAAAVRVCAPCPHQRPCPMLASPRDWCHEVRSWKPTPRVDAIQRLTRRRDERAKFSFVVLAPVPSPPPVAALPPGSARLVSDPLVSKGKTERLTCAVDGALRRLRLLDRERSPGNVQLAAARRGSLVVMAPVEMPERVPPAAVVRVAD